MSNKKRKIAVCISGTFRHWDLTRSTILKMDEYLRNCEVDYFLTTWNSSVHTQYEEHNGKNSIKYWDQSITTSDFLSDFNGKNLISYQILNTTQIKKTNLSDNCQPMFYLNMRCNQLKTEHELKHDFIYDYVILIRPDTFVTENMVNDMNNFMNDYGGFNNERSCGLVYMSNHNIVTDTDGYYGYVSGDQYCMLTSATSDIYFNMYNYWFKQKDSLNTIPTVPHSANALYSLYNSLVHSTHNPYVLTARANARHLKNKLQNSEWVWENYGQLDQLSHEWHSKCIEYNATDETYRIRGENE